MTALKATIPAEEFNALCGRINEKRGVTNIPKDVDYVDSTAFSPRNYDQTARQMIDGWKEQLGSDKEAKAAVSNIFAARTVVDTKGGKASYLDEAIPASYVKQVAKTLGENEHYQNWLADVDRNKAARLLNGHGGALEEDFRKYLRTLPAGELKNDPALKRYLPTAKERIEELQKQVKAKNKGKRQLWRRIEARSIL